MTGSLYISVDAINPPSLAAPSKLQFAAANGSQPVALVYTDFEYNHIAKSRKEKNADNCKHIGLAYQNVKDIMPTICGLDKDGYGYINYISPDFISLIAGAVQLNILGLYKVENKTQQLERRIKDLEAEISMLKQRGLGN